MARSRVAKRKAVPDARVIGRSARDLNANDGRGGHARAHARKAAVKKAFGLLTGKQ